MGIKHYISVSIFILGVTLSSNAQNVTSSPYSIFGIGEIETGEYGENAGMGGVGIGFRQLNTVYTANPASFTTLASRHLSFDGSVSIKFSDYSSKRAGKSAISGNLQRIALATRASKHWALGAGLVPYSRVGYLLQTTQNVEGNPEMLSTTSFEGSGGLTKFFITNAVQIANKLSVGVNSSLIFGSLRQDELQQAWTIERVQNTHKIIFDAGIQYEDSLSRNLVATVGLVGGYHTQLKMHNNLYAYDNSGAVAVDKFLAVSHVDIPEYYGIGIGLSARKGWSAGLDYRFQRWSKLDTRSSAFRYQDVNKIAIGMSYVPNVINPLKYGELIQYQLGFSASNSYIKYKDQEPYNLTVTAGAIFPLRNSCNLNLALEYGRNGAGSSLHEDYFKITIGFSFRDIWYIQRQFD